MKAGRKKGTVGIVGLGIMGGAFARHLVDAGWHVVGFDVDSGINRKMAKLGVEIVADVATLAQKVPTILTSLPNPQALAATVAAICEVKLPPKVIIEASTFTLDDKLRAHSALKKAGHTTIDCPVSGTGIQAENKDVVFYASGDSKAIARLKPMFAAFSRGYYDVGEFGNGSKMKYVANLLVAIHNVASAEAMVLGMKSGLDRSRIVELIGIGAGNSRMFELRAPMMVKEQLRQADHEDEGVPEGYGRHRRLCRQARRADADILCDPADLCGGPVDGAWPAGHRRRLRGHREDGRAEAAQGQGRPPKALAGPQNVRPAPDAGRGLRFRPPPRRPVRDPRRLANGETHVIHRKDPRDAQRGARRHAYRLGRADHHG